MNELDSELVWSQLRARGFERTLERDLADVVLFNTCSVREHAEQKVWSRLGELKFVKNRRSGMVIGVIGCMAEREGKGLYHKYPHVDIMCGPAELDQLVGMVENAVATASAGNAIVRQTALMGGKGRRSSTLEAAAEEDTLELLDLSRSVSGVDGVSQAYVRITRGCDKFCSYCVVPYTRGKEVHRPAENIVNEVKMLVLGGAKEVTLLGQTVNHYHHENTDGSKTTFAQLLRKVHDENPDLKRLRFVTSFPRDFGNDALEAMRDCGRICRYLHIPAQSGSNNMLRAMNRGYTVEQYLDLIDRARGMMPDLCIASDFIVGFPGETEEDHQASLELIKRCRFKNSFIFKYSPRPGTTAIKRFVDDVPEEVKRRRNAEMLAVQQQVAIEENHKMMGRVVEVMVEGESELSEKAIPGEVEVGWIKRKKEGKVQLVGRTGGDQVVCFDGDLGLKGELVKLRIMEVRNMTLIGERE